MSNLPRAARTAKSGIISLILDAVLTTSLLYLKNQWELFIIMEDIMLEIKNVLDAERLITARMVDSILRTSQVAGHATPEMQEMFNQWLNLVSAQILREGQEGECDVPAVARKIGVSEATIFSLLGFLHRCGKIRVETVNFSSGDGKNLETCSCLEG